MPQATDEQIPKPLTYTLMYHFLWFVVFLASTGGLTLLFLTTGSSDLAAALVPPLSLLFYTLVAAAGSLATYVVRVRVLLGEMSKDEAFHWSAISSWFVLAFAPLTLIAWWLTSQALDRFFHLTAADWPLEAHLTAGVVRVEVIVWWLSHLLSVRGISRGRKRYLPLGARPGAPTQATASVGTLNEPALPSEVRG